MSLSWSFAYRRHGGAVRAYLQKRLNSREEVEDLCQETFMRVMGAEARLREPDKLRSYLLSTAHNLLVNHLRRRGLVKVESELGEVVRIEDLAEGGESGDGVQRALDLELALRRELLRLPADQRRAFELGAIQRWPYAEIAAEVGHSVSKVKVDVYRARKELMARLKDYQPRAMAGGAGREGVR